MPDQSSTRLTIAAVAIAAVATAFVSTFVALAVAANPVSMPADTNRPRQDPVAGWGHASGLAGVALYAPDEGAGLGTGRIVVRGIAGDPYRPVEATYDGGLRISQTHRDVIPAPDDPESFVPIDGADEAWRFNASDEDYLHVRFGDTLVVLSGLPADELVAVARALRRVEES